MNRCSPMAAFTEAVSRFGHHTAIEWQNQRISYRQLDELSGRLATTLVASGAHIGDRIAVAMRSNFNVIPALLAIWKAGCVFVPLDVNNPATRLKAMISLVEPQWLLTEAEVAEAAGAIAEAFPEPRIITIEHVSHQRPVDPKCIEERASALGPDDMCYLYFTSGSTGIPKAIAGRSKSVDHFIGWEAKTFNITEGCRVSQLTHSGFDAFLRDVLLPLYTGGSICIPANAEMMIDAPRLIGWIDEQKIELIHCVPSLFRMLLNGGVRQEQFQALKYVLLAGEALSPADVKKWMAIFGDRIQLVNLYGPSETTMVKFFHRVSRADADRRSVPIGKPIEGARALIISPEGKVCPPNFAGEICIRTPYSSLGYYKQPELTRQVFVPNPFSNDPDDIVYRTGDMGRMLEDGTFEFLGRTDFQVKIRGMRVELGEIENALRACVGVNDAVVVSAHDRNDELYLTAYVAAAPELQIDAVRSELLNRLPENLIPANMLRLDSLPRTYNGKVDRKALPVPERQRSTQVALREASTETEKLLSAVWSELLGMDRLGVDDDFFALGGHSLLATKLMARIQNVFDVEVPLAALFENPTIARLSLVIEDAQAEASGDEVLAEVLDEVDRLSNGSNISTLDPAGTTK
jgi:amino acid adenylation domain-containing protein